MSRLGPESPRSDRPARPVVTIRCSVHPSVLGGFDALGRVRIGNETLTIGGTGATAIEALQAALAMAERYAARKRDERT